MKKPPPDIPVVVVHDRTQAEAAVRHAETLNCPLNILYSATLALAGGPTMARVMVPDSGPDSILHVLDCGPDPGCAWRAIDAGWSHITVDETGASLTRTIKSLALQKHVTVWQTSQFMKGRTVLNLDGCPDPSAVLTRGLG